MMIPRHSSLLLVVDIQERLLPAIADRPAILAAAAALLQGAARLAVPVLFTEQNPAGIGGTLPALRALAPAAPVAEKDSFDALAAPEPRRLILAADRPDIVVCGLEAHVCVLQTVFGLCAAGLRPWLVADAVGSRKPFDRDIARQRLAAAGVPLVTAEMVLFEWLGDCRTPAFRDLLPVIRGLALPAMVAGP